MNNGSNEGKGNRIAKNTIFLYIRMVFLMFVSLYTSRVILDALGEDDYGYYNVIGGVVGMFAILTQSLSNAVSRFLNYEMGKGNKEKLKRIFSCSLTILSVLALAVAVVTELGGCWWVNNMMVISHDRLDAANWVLQFSILTFCITLVSAPYNAAIIAHEKMSAFAYISIIEGVAKLIVAYLIIVSPIDRLTFYAFLLLLIQIFVFLLYVIYCHKNFQECHYSFVYDSSMMKEMFSYAGWTFIGNAAFILKKQGTNIILNLFTPPSVNAARAIAMYVDNTVAGFSSNFFTAVKPQITQSYSRGDHEFMMRLIFKSSRFSFYLLLIMGLPVIMSSDFILNIWLEEVPDYTMEFVNLMLVNLMLETLSQPLIVANSATGRIRNYQLIVGGIQLLNIPVSYIFLQQGITPEIVVIVSIALECASLVARAVILRSQMQLPLLKFFRGVILNVLFVSLTSSVLPVICWFNMSNDIVRFAVLTSLCITSTIASIWFIGCDTEEKIAIRKQVVKITNKFKKS